MTKVAVVGAGLAGLCAAVRLADAGCEVEVLEGRDEIGGRSRSRLVDGAVIELGASFSRGHTVECASWLRMQGCTFVERGCRPESCG
jgi:phytoene dehydrogenase-like protein